MRSTGNRNGCGSARPHCNGGLDVLHKRPVCRLLKGNGIADCQAQCNGQGGALHRKCRFLVISIENDQGSGSDRK